MPTATHRSTWDARIARARELAASRPAARDLLTFYASLAEYQRTLAASVSDPVEAIPGFMEWLRQNGRSDLAGSIDIDRVAESVDTNRVASGFSRKDTAAGGLPPEGGSHQIGGGSHESESESPADRFVVESLLQAFADQSGAPDSAAPASGSPVMRCPRCAALPVAAVLREAAHGAKRFLLCSLCLHEWECLRIVCPACGEQEFDKLPVYTAEQFAHVRVDACDSCRRYIKTIDLTKDGLAVPCVDDIATVSLDLWARERGYMRIWRNVLAF